MLEKRLYQLLFRHACVVVPQFGAFLTEKLPARISAHQHTLYPPSRRLYFNAQLTHNDGLLVHLWMSETGCSYEEALDQIQTEVTQWKKLLVQQERLVLPLLGHFYQAGTQSIVFQPNDDANFLKSSFGLAPVSVQGLAQSHDALTSSHDTEPKVAATEETTDVELALEPLVNAPPQSVSQPWSYWKYAAVYLAGIGLMGYVGIQSYQWWEQRQNAQQFAIHARVEQQVKQKIQAASFVIEPKLPTAQPMVQQVSIYHVVTGSFRDLRHAQNAFKNLIAQGYQAHILPKNNKGLHPVVYGSFTQLDQAEALLQQVRQHQADAWLYMQ